MSLLVIVAVVWVLLALATVGLCIAAGLADRAAAVRVERRGRARGELPAEVLRTGFPTMPTASR